MRTWRGDQDLPPTVDDETVAWMTEAAVTGKMNPARPAKTRQHGDPNPFASPDENEADDT